MNRRPFLAALSFCVATACGGEPCDRDALIDALAVAESGDTVTAGNCIITGNFTVPAGVTLAGLGTTKTRLVSELDTSPLLTVETDASAPSRIEDLSLESLGRAAIVVRGEGAFEAVRLAITVARGIGIGASSVSSATLTDVALLGPVTVDNASFLPPTVTETDAATFGVVLVQTQAELTRVDVAGFGVAGAVFMGTDAVWNAGNIDGNFPIGVYALSGALVLDDLIVRNTIQGARSLPAFGGFFSDSDVTTTGAQLADTQGYGFFHLGGAAHHGGLVADGNLHAAIWGQSMTELEVEATITDNAFAGIVAAGVGELSIHDTEISNTAEALQVFDTYGALVIGDGIQLIYPLPSATIENVTLDDNDRIGMLIDLDGASLGNLTLTNIAATVTSSVQGGVVLQNGTAPSGWDNGVLRSGTSDAADRAFRRVDALGVVGPCDYPTPLTGILP